jgi:hypothetical protein
MHDVALPSSTRMSNESESNMALDDL